MIRTVVALSGPLVLLWPQVAAAELKDDRADADDNIGKWSLTMSGVAANAAIRIVDSDIQLPEGLAEGDFEVSLSDELTVSSTIVSGSIGYRVLPFAEVFARGGLISSDTQTGLVISGTPNGLFSNFFDGPITIDRETSQEVDGYSLGLGVKGFLPIAEIGADMLAAYAGFQYNWNRFDDTVSSEGTTTSFGLIYPIDLDRQKIVYRVGASYNWISRDVEQAFALNGEPVRVRVTQEFENPWALEAGIGIPIAKGAMLGLGAWRQMSGETSFLASLTYRFGSND